MHFGKKHLSIKVTLAFLTQCYQFWPSGVGANYLQFLNEPQIEAWALYNAVWAVNSNLFAETVKSSEQHWDRRFKSMAGQFWCSCAENQQEKFLYKLDVEYTYI